MDKILEKTIDHLKNQYDGIFLPEQIDNHINNYILENQSNYLIQKIIPLIKKGAKILDIGSGYGSFVLKAIDNGYEAFGIEIEKFENEISKERAIKKSINPTRFSLGSALSLPYPDESFDMVSFWNVLEHISDYKKAIQEAKRVLKPGGRMFIIAPNYFSFRKEAHYHLPWIPLFPKPLARLYLRALGRKTEFLEQCIFYVTIFGLKRYLSSQNLCVSIDINEKISINHVFQSSKLNTLIAYFKKHHHLGLLKKIIFFSRTHPFIPSIDIIAIKND